MINRGPFRRDDRLYRNIRQKASVKHTCPKPAAHDAPERSNGSNFVSLLGVKDPAALQGRVPLIAAGIAGAVFLFLAILSAYRAAAPKNNVTLPARLAGESWDDMAAPARMALNSWPAS